MSSGIDHGLEKYLGMLHKQPTRSRLPKDPKLLVRNLRYDANRSCEQVKPRGSAIVILAHKEKSILDERPKRMTHVACKMRSHCGGLPGGPLHFTC